MAGINLWRRREEPERPDGSNLVYLVSQPRSGSTLLQRTLAQHPDLHVTSEPWIMLHPLRALERRAFTATHDAQVAHTALMDFLAGLPGGTESYYTAVAKFADHLYGEALAVSGATLFLDKTPRYYLVLDELAKVFPRARFLLLVRNPAAVMSSVYRTWVKDDARKLLRYSADLLDAPSAIIDARSSLGSRALWLRYEDYVVAPDAEIRRILEFLSLPPLDGTAVDIPRFTLGDQGNVYEYDEPQSAFRDSWVEHLGDPQLSRWIGEYVDLLGDPVMSALGYDAAGIKATLAAHAHGDTDGTVALLEALGRPR